MQAKEPRDAKDCQKSKLEGARKDRPPEPSEGAWFCQHLDLRLPASRAVKESISVKTPSLGYFARGHRAWGLEGLAVLRAMTHTALMLCDLVILSSYIHFVCFFN